MFPALLENASKKLSPTQVVFALAMVALAVEPVVWLVRTWVDPVYESPGGWIFAALIALVAWSLNSALREGEDVDGVDVAALALLVLTATLRLAGHLVAISVLGAASLAVDAWAIARLLRLHKRERALAPFWLAVLFAFTLPLERVIQRLIGFPLQMVSAKGACEVLDFGFGDVVCNGVMIQVSGTPVLVDLPCSGARGLMMLGVAFAVIAATSRPGWRHSIVGALVALASAYASNVVRISALSAGVAIGPETLGFDVMASPGHDLVGWAALAVGVLPVLMWARLIRPDAAGVFQLALDAKFKKPLTLVASFIAIAAVVVLALAPSKPVDVSRPLESLHLPRTLLGHVGESHELTDHEEAFYTRYGGVAARTSYGANMLLVVRTSSPLRHIHGPDECLRGLGYRVERLGIRFEGDLPHALYRAVDPQGKAWRVAVTYVSDDGVVATNIAEAVHRWMSNRDIVWSVYERVQPWDATDAHRSFDAAVVGAFDLNQPLEKFHAQHATGDLP